jgi:hypothetical protein
MEDIYIKMLLILIKRFSKMASITKDLSKEAELLKKMRCCKVFILSACTQY